MRVLLAYDGSVAADEAVTLATSVEWPSDSTIRVAGVVEPPLVLPGVPWAGAGVAVAPEVDAQMAAHLEAQVAEAVRRLRSTGAGVEGAVLRGRPATVLVDEAGAFGADLVVAGSRGHGEIATLVLGSVSAEIVDHAPCPVLVARRPSLHRILFATDASEASAAAEAVLVAWRIIANAAVRVLSVASIVEPWHTGIAPTMYRQVVDAYSRDLEEAKVQHRRIASEAADRLAAAGRTVDHRIATGDAATAIVAGADEFEADLVVLGSRGQTGLTRMVLGSTARNVLHGSHASVLIVHPPGGGGGRAATPAQGVAG
ncbi:MAG TPA: universal stress protein [Candidatus Limnocylindrales bacterium]|nr:universal stress protein [Candidatus Limnocylindrales bacterium]